MRTAVLLTLPLAAALALPAVAQSTNGAQQPAASTQSSSQPAAGESSSNPAAAPAAASDANSDQNLSARQPLQPEVRQGFWGKMNPFARKKYVQRQLSPIRNRVNELDDLTAENSRQIKDVDARAQEGIRQADAKATEADQHAVDASNRAQQANETATQASNRLNTVESVVGNIDQYQPAGQTEIRFRAGNTVLGSASKQALDDMTANLGSQKGYVIEVQGFSTAAGRAGVSNSQAMANSVVRYLVEHDNVPVYRIYVMGMGNAKLPETEGSSRAHGNRVEISLLKNGVDQLASATPAAMNSGYQGSATAPQSGTTNYQSRSYSNQPPQQPTATMAQPQ